MHVSQEYQTASTIQNRFAKSVRARSLMALREVAIWNHASVWVALILSAASAYQAFYAMHNIGMAGEGGIDAWIVGAVALALVISTNCTAARFSSLGFGGRSIALVVLIMLTGFSAVTSGYHVANIMLSAGNDAVQTSPAAIRARGEYRQAVTARDAVERSASIADERGDTAAAGHIRSTQLPRAELRVDNTLNRLEMVTSSGQGATGDAATLHAIARELGTTVDRVVMVFAICVVLLGELVRLATACESASILRRMAGNARNQQGATA